MTTSPSTVAVRPVQLEFEFMHTTPLQLTPAGFAALRKAVGSEPIVTASSS
jgi:hypothetical protein